MTPFEIAGLVLLVGIGLIAAVYLVPLVLAFAIGFFGIVFAGLVFLTVSLICWLLDKKPPIHIKKKYEFNRKK